jgi:translin
MRTSELQVTTGSILDRFDILSAARDRALTEGRQIIRLSANTVRAVHRGELSEAASLLGESKALLSALIDHLAPYPSIYWAGYVQDAMKEFAEANLTLAIVGGEAIPGPDDLGIEDAPYLNALAESASELRREVLDRLRADESARAENLLSVMADIYDVLITVDFPDAITGGLRRTTDQLRAVLERTRGDLTVALTQKRLQRSLADARRALGDQSLCDDAGETLPLSTSEDES